MAKNHGTAQSIHVMGALREEAISNGGEIEE